MANNKLGLLDFGDDPDQDADPGILTEFLPLRQRGNCKNFSGSAVLARFAVQSVSMVSTVLLSDVDSTKFPAAVNSISRLPLY